MSVVSLGSIIVFSPLSGQVGLKKLGHLNTKQGCPVISSLHLMARCCAPARRGLGCMASGAPSLRFPSRWPRDGNFNGLSFGATM